MAESTCSTEGCDSLILSRGLCHKHYAKWYRANRTTTPCSIDGCTKAADARGWCQAHYTRWKKHGDPLVVRHRHDGNRVDPGQSKVCIECGVVFHPVPGRSHEQWGRTKFCGAPCANAVKARGRTRKTGDISRAVLGSKAAYQRVWLQRKAMPHWATWWEDRRRAEDLAEIYRTLVGGPYSYLGSRPKVRHWVAGSCPDCNETVIVIRGWWHDSIRCPSCTKRRWQQNHKQRARMRGVEYKDIPPAVVFARDKRRCQICGHKTRGKHPAPTSATIDHIVPLSKGGPHLLHNLQTACLRCNVKKYNGAANDQMRLAV